MTVARVLDAGVERVEVRPVARAVSGAGGVAVALPASRVVAGAGPVSVLHAPMAAALAGPGGIAHAQSDLHVYTITL